MTTATTHYGAIESTQAHAADQVNTLYSQVESAQGRGSAGLGIGLALVKSLVELHGRGQSSDREMAFETGFDRHLTKPVDCQRFRNLFDELDILNRENSVLADLQTGGFH